MIKPKKNMMLYGRISVYERLKAKPSTIKKILIQESIKLDHIENLAKSHHILIERQDSRQLAKVMPAKDLQSVVALVDKFKYVSFNDILSQLEKKEISVLFLDRINDPHNLGAIIRTAACFGRLAVVIPQFDACGITEAVLHVAAGGENYVSVALVPNISTAIIQAKESGCWIYGAEGSDDAIDLENVSLSYPLGFVLGSEGGGIRYGIQKNLDFKVRIPMRGASLSFNVAAATAVFCYEVTKQRQVKS